MAGLRAAKKERSLPVKCAHTFVIILKKCWYAVEYVQKHWQVAAVLVVACFAGAALLLYHWLHTPWEVRSAELDAAGWSRPMSAHLLEQLDAAAFRWQLFLALVLLAAGGLLGRAVSAGPMAQRVARAAGWTLIAIIPIYAAEGWLLVRALGSVRADTTHLTAYALWLQGVTFFEYALLPAAALVAVLGGITAFVRLAVSGTNAWLMSYAPVPFDKFRKRIRNRMGREAIHPSQSLGACQESRPWPRGENAHWHESRISSREPPGSGGLGICLSGGGIRSATFALGALQALQAHRALKRDIPGHSAGGPRVAARKPGVARGRCSELTRAKYLSAVSGGAYIAGAFLLAVRPPRPPLNKKGGRDKKGGEDERVYGMGYDNVFTPGSPEFDHLRKHSSYIADGLKEWAVAILVVIRGALVSTLFLALMALVSGRWVGYLYHEIGRKPDFDEPWQPVWGAVFITLAVIGLALLLWAASTLASIPPDLRGKLAEIAKMTCFPVAILVLFGALFPIVTWSSVKIIDLTSGGSGLPAGGMVAGTAKGGILGLIGFIITIIGLLTRQRAEILAAVRTKTKNLSTQLGDLGKRAVQWLAVYSGLTLIAVVYLIVFGYSTYTSAIAGPRDNPVIHWGTPTWTFPLTNFGVTIGLTALLIVLYLIADETALGLHPFYRRRLTSAFAVRRVRYHPSADKPASYKAEPYDWQEDTKLETHGGAGRRGPQVIFCASAHCSDPDLTPPGRHVLPFTFSYDAIGGPEVGWCAPKSLRQWVSPRLCSDLTVQAAMAVSGAAFASGMGSYRGPANVILALTNARLGTWIANPRLLTDRDSKWCQARPPRIRRLSYLLREIFGWYPKSLPLLFVTDGGHYESLGLIELLRRNCTEIYCFDASSDMETFADSLGRAVTLAFDEFGIKITPNNPEKADPRTGKDKIEFGDLKGRMAATPIITATVTYPPQKPGGQETFGVLVIGRTTLDPNTPWEIQRHAACHPLFPYDATGDQWFDDRKFNAYTALGRHVGLQAINAMAIERSKLSSPESISRSTPPLATRPTYRPRRPDRVITS